MAYSEQDLQEEPGLDTTLARGQWKPTDRGWAIAVQSKTVQIGDKVNVRKANGQWKKFIVTEVLWRHKSISTVIGNHTT